MSISTDGLLGASVVVLVVYMIYVFGTKKSSWNLPSLDKIKTPTVSENWLLAISGVLVLLWGMYTPGLRPSEIGQFGSRYWLQIVIGWGIFAALIALNKEVFGTATKTLQGVLAGIVFFLLVGFPTWSWISGPSGTLAVKTVAQAPLKEPAQILPQNAPKLPLAKDLKQEEWPQLVLAEDGESERIPIPFKMRVVTFGEDFRVHCVYRDGHEIDFGKGEEPCPDGDMPYVYVTNEAEGPNMISYAYAPIGSS